MTNDEKYAEIERIVVAFTREYLDRRLLWQLGQIVPGADDHPNVRNVLLKLHEGPEGLRYTMEPQEWLTMALYGAGVRDEDAGEMREIFQSFAEWLFAIPGSYQYEIPDGWANTDMGALWRQALLRTQGDDLVTIAQAAEIAGVTVQAMSQRVTRGITTHVMSTTSIAIVTSSRSGSGALGIAAFTTGESRSTRPHTTAIITTAMRPREGCGATVPGGGVNHSSRPVSLRHVASAST